MIPCASNPKLEPFNFLAQEREGFHMSRCKSSEKGFKVAIERKPLQSGRPREDFNLGTF